MNWYCVPDPASRPPVFDMRRVGVRQSLADEIATPEFELNTMLLRHTDLWTQLLPEQLPDDDVRSSYAEHRDRLSTTPARGHVDCLHLLRRLRHPERWSLEGETRGDWWQRPTAEGWADADERLDHATGGRYRKALRRLDELQEIYGRAERALDAAQASELVRWPEDSEVFQYGGAKTWGPFVEHRALVDRRFLDIVGGPDELRQWGGVLSTVRIVDKQGQRRDPEYRLLGASLVAGAEVMAPDRPALARTPGLGTLVVSGAAREVLAPLFPAKAEWEPLEDLERPVAPEPRREDGA